MAFPNRHAVPEYSSPMYLSARADEYNRLRRQAFGACCQWVLDAVCETAEWFHQPSGFDSLTLLRHSTPARGLDIAAGRAILSCFANGVQY